MPPKKPSLAERLAAAQAQQPPASPPPVTLAEPNPDAPQPQRNAVAGSTTPPSRQGKRQLGGYFDPAVVKQFKLLSIERDLSQERLLAEALNDLFEKYGKPRLA